MTPGTHVAVLADRSDVGVEGRLLGLELRDTLFVLRPGPTAGFVFLFRAPLSEATLAGQVLASGTGGLNIDACRVAADLSEFFSKTGKPRSGMGHARGYGMGDGYGGDRANPPHQAGRWPPNVLLVHGPGCRKAGIRRVPSGVAHRTKSGGRAAYGNRVKPPLPDMTYAEDDGLETACAYECEEGCPVRMVDDQSGLLSSGMMHAGQPRQRSEGLGGYHGGFRGSATANGTYGDSGGASRFYPQFQDEDELLAWLTRLMGGGQVLRDG